LSSCDIKCLIAFKDSGLHDYNIKIFLIEEGLDIPDVENIISRLKPMSKVKKIKHALLVMLLGIIMFSLGATCSWIFAFGSSFIFMLFVLIAVLGIVVFAVGLLKLL
jgi:hypothetical protein